jgi:DNA polymerase III subunit epsilon
VIGPWWLRPGSDAAATYARATGVRGATPWREASFCVVDLELTGLNPRCDQIVSWAAVWVEGGRVVSGSAAEGLVRPSCAIPPASVRVHGLRAVDLAGAPSMPEAVDPLLTAMTGRVLVAHAAWVEQTFLRPALRARGVRLRNPVVDTSALGSKWLARGGRRTPDTLSLSGLAAVLGLPSHRPHEASGDAFTTAQVFIALASLLEADRPETVRTLAATGQRLHTVR